MTTTTRRPFISTLVCLSPIVSIRASFAACSSCGKGDRLCGPKCMLAVCQKLGIDANLDELTVLCGTNEQGSTLAGLYSAAKAKGLEAVGMKTGVDELAVSIQQRSRWIGT